MSFVAIFFPGSSDWYGLPLVILFLWSPLVHKSPLTCCLSWNWHCSRFHTTFLTDCCTTPICLIIFFMVRVSLKLFLAKLYKWYYLLPIASYWQIPNISLTQLRWSLPTAKYYFFKKMVLSPSIHALATTGLFEIETLASMCLINRHLPINIPHPVFDCLVGFVFGILGSERFLTLICDNVWFKKVHNTTCEYS